MASLNVPAFTQQHLRLRVASTTFQEDGQDATYDHATHYSYDIHGNVKELVQDHRQMALDVGGSATDPMRYKRLKYRYDLVSGNVREVKYQEGHHDQFFHRYAYDADNRITKAETSLDASLWHVDAEYFYYPHGPLQRVELGEHKVQGLDHAYTLQGWLKGINSEVLSPEADQGQDGWVAQGNPNALVGRDAFGLSLTYHGNDYRPIDLARWGTGANDGSRPLALQAWGTPEWAGLYNGNIAGTVHSLQPFGVGGWQGTAGEVGQALAGLYRYDQLNRLREMRTRAGLAAGNDWTEVPAPTGADLDTYRSSYAYDANGNILTADRWDQSGAPYDALKYKYQGTVPPINPPTPSKLIRNRLYELYDDDVDPNDDGATEDIMAVNDPNTTPPLTPELSHDAGLNSTSNYHYDALGNLIHDQREQINEIQWTVSGKVKAVTRTTGSTLQPLEFGYGASGQRISKQVGGAVGDPGTYREHYIRDAQGNIMATYRLHANGAFRLQERPIYGSARVGLYAAKVDLYPAGQIVPMPQVIPVFDGLLRYELNDHLGNVGTVVTGRLLVGQGAQHEAEVISAQGYEPFGSLLPGRNYSSGSYRYLFQGQEHDDEINGSVGTSYAFEYRMHDPRIGRFLSIDPLAAKYPFYSPYAFSGNRVIDMIELEGLEPEITADKLKAMGDQNSAWGFGARGNENTGWQQDINGQNYQTYKCADCYTSAGNKQGTGLAGNELVWGKAPALASATQGTADDPVAGDVAPADAPVLGVPNAGNVQPPPAPGQPVMPAMRPSFAGGLTNGQAAFSDPDLARAEIQPVVDWMNNNPDARITLLGGVGFPSPPAGVNLGSSNAVWAQPDPTTPGQPLSAVGLARAQLVRQTMIGMGVAPDRLWIGLGTVAGTTGGRIVTPVLRR